MPKIESDVVFEMFFYYFTTGMDRKIFNDSFNIFWLYLTIMFISLK